MRIVECKNIEQAFQKKREEAKKWGCYRVEVLTVGKGKSVVVKFEFLERIQNFFCNLFRGSKEKDYCLLSLAQKKKQFERKSVSWAKQPSAQQKRSQDVATRALPVQDELLTPAQLKAKREKREKLEKEKYFSSLDPKKTADLNFRAAPLNEWSWTGEDFEEIAQKYTNLTFINFPGTSYRGEDISAIFKGALSLVKANSNTLTDIRLHNIALSDDELVEIANVCSDKLTRVLLPGRALLRSHLAFAKRCPNLANLRVGQDLDKEFVPLKKEDLEEVARLCTKLEVLSLPTIEESSLDEVQQIFTANPNLTHVTLSKVTKGVLQSAFALKQLRSFKAGDCSLVEELPIPKSIVPAQKEGKCFVRLRDCPDVNGREAFKKAFPGWSVTVVTKEEREKEEQAQAEESAKKIEKWHKEHS